MANFFLSILFLFIVLSDSYGQSTTARELKESIQTLNKKVSNLRKSISKKNNSSQSDKQRVIIESNEIEEGYIGFPLNTLPKNKRLIAGSVFSMSKSGENYELSQEANDKKVIGVLTEASIGKSNKKHYFIATSGKVRVRVGCTLGEKCQIEVGDLLITSDEWGVATKCTDNAQCIGSIIGKALEPHNSRTREGYILVLLMLQ